MTGAGSSGARVGIVVIGRNEGERLRVSLRAARASGAPIVYADSHSSDGSCDLARTEGAEVVAIDEPPFTAARGRNAGMARLCEMHPDVEYVQFVDGDTAIEAGWPERGAAALAGDPEIAAVCGHLLERDAATCVWRRLMQMEWRGPVGDIRSCGGIAMYRRTALDRVGRFRESLVGGEEPELCERLRAAGGRIVRIDVPMGVHDSAIDSFGAWWTRVVRVGVAFAGLLGDADARQPEAARRAVRSALVWGLALPGVAALSLAASFLDPRAACVAAAVLVVYVVQTVRIAGRAARGGMSPRDARLYAVSCVGGKFPLVQGWLRHRLGAGRSAAPARPAAACGSGAEAHS